MNSFQGDFDLFLASSFSQREAEEAHEFCFDDEPLERILYGENAQGPTRANLYLSALPYIQKMIRACSDGDLAHVVETASELVNKRYRISAPMCFQLAIVMSIIVPSYPNPALKQDLFPLGPLLEQMWDLAMKAKDESLQKMVGGSLYRWYEHHRHYQDAKQVLSTLIRISQKEQDRITEATMTNNLGFEYLLEGRPHDAKSFFEKAATIFKENGDILNYANARANYWTCRFECDDFKAEEAAIETELQSIAEILEDSAAWHKRKPLILLAKIEERRGNIPAAIRLVEQAITASKSSNTRYPEQDAEYAETLKRAKNSRGGKD